MKILVINGSPKGAYSITLQTVNYLMNIYREHEFQVVHVGQRIKSLETDSRAVMEMMEQADLILFAYPVYTFLAPAQLHRFIELIKEGGISLKGKWATQITTSKHFYDVTAHRYIRDNCQDLGMRYIEGLSADMEDLLSEKGREEARGFFDHVCWCVEQGICEICREPGGKTDWKPVPVSASKEGNGETHDPEKGNVAVVTDCRKEDSQLKAMIERFCCVFPGQTRVINIREFPFQGGCLGCFHCAVSGECIYKDGFDRFLREDIQQADGVVYAFSIQDHSMGSRFKMYDDRQFCNGHRTVTMGSPVGYLVSGELSREQNLQMVIEARAQVGGNYLAGIAGDEKDPEGEIRRLGASLEYALVHKYRQPQNFYGVGGMKIFRDLIWLMRGMMKADHRFYKAHGQYDFPQKRKRTALKMYLVGMLLSSPKLKAKIGNRMNEGMIMPYKKVLEQAKKYRDTVQGDHLEQM